MNDATTSKAEAGTPDRGTQDAGSTTTTATTTAPPLVECGSRTCPAPDSLFTLIGDSLGALGGLLGGLPMPAACCLDEAAGTCGIQMSASAPCEALATPDTRCPSVDLGALGGLAGNMGFGCCVDDGLCGVDGATFGRGCVENDEAKSMLDAAGIGAFIVVPDARTCDESSDAGVEEDAGM